MAQIDIWLLTCILFPFQWADLLANRDVLTYSVHILAYATCSSNSEEFPLVVSPCENSREKIRNHNNLQYSGTICNLKFQVAVSKLPIKTPIFYYNITVLCAKEHL